MKLKLPPNYFLQTPNTQAHGLRAKASPNLALLSIDLVSTSLEMVTSDFGRHSCWIKAFALP